MVRLARNGRSLSQEPDALPCAHTFFDGLDHHFAAVHESGVAQTLSGSEPSVPVRCWGSSGSSPTLLASVVIRRSLTLTHRRQQCPRSVPLPPDPDIIRHDRLPGRHASIPKIQLAVVTLQHQRICSPNARFPSQSTCRPGARSWRCAAPCWHREVLAPDELAKAGNVVPHRMPRELDLPVSG